MLGRINWWPDGSRSIRSAVTASRDWIGAIAKSLPPTIGFTQDKALACGAHKMGIKINEIIRTRRKTIALVIAADARLIVRAPLSTSREYIDRVVERKKGWIQRKQQEIIRRNEAYLPKQYLNGDDFLLLGASYRLEYNSDVSAVVFEGGRLLMPLNRQSEAATLIRQRYVDEAKEVFQQRTEYYASVMNIKYKSVRLSTATRRWGSCGINGTLNFSWRLIMAPVRVIDSVVVHELSHIEFRNHSKDFWTRVRMTMPDYDCQKKWLADNQRLLETV
jgi:predicted metal-dependent hydrolase